MNNKQSVRFLATAGLIAAMYVALTLGVAPLSFGLIQCRISEAMTVLAAFTPAAIPGLTVGCAVANLLGLSLGAGTVGLIDVIVGPLATGVAAFLSWQFRRVRIKSLPVLSTVPPVILNAVAVGSELMTVVPHPTVQVWLIQAGLVAVGETVACVGGGLLLAKLLDLPAVRRYF